MKTVIEQLIEEVKANMAGVGISSKENGVSKMEQQWFQASYSTMSKILLDLEVNYLAIEKEQITSAFKSGEKNIDFIALHGQGKLSDENKYYKDTYGSTS